MALDWGIKVSQTGSNVGTTDETQLIFKTNSSLLKVMKSGQISVSVGGGFVTVNHGLGYVPQFLVYVPDPSNSGRMRMATASFTFGVAKADTNNLYIADVNGSGTAYYYIFYEPASSGSAPSITPSADYGIKTSKDGFDVLTANILQQSFNSEKNCLKIASEGNSSINGNGTITLAHGLSYIPASMVWFQVAGDGNWYPAFTTGSGCLVTPYTDSTNLVCEVSTSAGQTVEVYYVLFVDPVVAV